MAILLVLLPVLVFVGVVLALRAASAAPVPVVSGRLRVVARSTRRWQVAGLVLGAAFAWGVQDRGSLGRGVLLAAPLGALVVLLGVVVGELRVPPPDGATRSALLEVRRVRDHLPRGLASAVGAATGLLGALLVLTTALGSPDDLGRPGRWLARSCTAVTAEGRGPWPGSFYSAPLAAVLVVGLAVALLAVQRVVRRPRSGEDAAVDDALRRGSVTAVTAAVGLLVTVPLAGVGAVASVGLLGICAAPLWWTVVGWSLLALVPASVVLGAWCGAVLVLKPSTAVARPDVAAASRA